MDNGVTVLPHPVEETDTPLRRTSRWAGLLLVGAGVVGGYLLASGGSGSLAPVVPTELAATVPSTSAGLAPVSVPTGSPPNVRAFTGTLLASVEFGRGLVTWPGEKDPVTIRLGSDTHAVAYDAAQDRIAATLPEYDGDRFALHVGRLGDLRFVASGVTGFAWHQTDPGAIAWVEEAGAGFRLVAGGVADDAVVAVVVAELAQRAEPVAWGAWGYALQAHDSLTTIAPSGDVIAKADFQFVAAGSDGRLIVARPAGTPLSSDWGFSDPTLEDVEPLRRFDEPDEHPTAATILPRSGRVVLVSNRFGDGTDLAKIEILSGNGIQLAVIRSGIIADSIAVSPDEARVAVGGFHYTSDHVSPVVLLFASDGSGSPIELPFDDQVRPLGIRD